MNMISTFLDQSGLCAIDWYAANGGTLVAAGKFLFNYPTAVVWADLQGAQAPHLFYQITCIAQLLSI